MPVQSTSDSQFPALVSAMWLSSRLQTAGVALLDCSWYLPASGRDAGAEYLSAHIPGAVRFDIDAVRDHRSELPHMLPGAAEFATAVELLGIQPADQVICYDGSGVNLSAARVWWMFRVFGHRNVAVLDGGFRSWSSATRPVQRGAVKRQPSWYGVPGVDTSLIRDRAAVEAIVAHPGAVQLVDCRPAARFRGEVDEPREGVRRGHIPGSANVPYPDFTDSKTGLLRSSDELRAVLGAQGLDPARPIVALCGSGTSACTLALAVEVIRASGHADVGPPVAVYDGSWSEWGR